GALSYRPVASLCPLRRKVMATTPATTAHTIRLAILSSRSGLRGLRVVGTTIQLLSVMTVHTSASTDDCTDFGGNPDDCTDFGDTSIGGLTPIMVVVQKIAPTLVAQSKDAYNAQSTPKRKTRQHRAHVLCHWRTLS